MGQTGARTVDYIMGIDAIMHRVGQSRGCRIACRSCADEVGSGSSGGVAALKLGNAPTLIYRCVQ